MLRLLREHGLRAPWWVGSPHGPCNHDGTIIPDSLDTMWGTDMTTTQSVEGQIALLTSHLLARAVNHHNAERVGIHGTRFEALEPSRQGVAGISALLPRAWYWAAHPPRPW